MYNEGDITRPGDLVDPTSGRFSQLVRKMTNLIIRPATPDIMAEESVVLIPMLKVVSNPFISRTFLLLFLFCFLLYFCLLLHHELSPTNEEETAVTCNRSNYSVVQFPVTCSTSNCNEVQS